MNSQNNINDELKDLNSGLPSSGDKNPYAVPEGYFEGLAGSILAKIKEQDAPAAAEIASLSPLLAGISRKMPYSLPDQYFDKGLQDLPYLIGEDPHSAILDLVERVTPYTVPTGYFANLPDQVLEKVAVNGTKMVSVSRTGTRWMRWAAAAVVAGIISITGYFYLSHRTGGLDAPQVLAREVKNVSTKELDDFIKTAGLTAASNETAQTTKSGAREVRKLLHDVSDKELDAFLNQLPADDEDLLLIN